MDDGAPVRSVTFGLTDAGRVLSESGNVGGLFGLGTMLTVCVGSPVVGLLRGGGGMGSSGSCAGMESPVDGIGADADGRNSPSPSDGDWVL